MMSISKLVMNLTLPGERMGMIDKGIPEICLF